MSKKNAKSAVSLSLLLLVALTSCGKSSNTLNRVFYEKPVDKCVDLAPIFQTIKKKQYRIEEEQDTDGNLVSYCYFNLFSSGTMKLTSNVSLSGGVKIISVDGKVKIIPDLNVNMSDVIKIAWNKDKDYAKVSDTHNYFYIGSEMVEGGKRYYKYCPTSILGVPVKFDITDLIVKPEPELAINGNKNDESYLIGPSFENAVVVEATYHTGYFFERDFGNNSYYNPPMYQGISFGISGFDTILNAFTPAMWLTGETLIKERSLNQLIDEIDAPEFTHQYSKKEDDSAVALNLKLDNYDLSQIAFTNIVASGKINLDYFYALENDFVRQHEIIGNLENVNLTYVYSNNPYQDKTAIILTDINSNIQFSEDVIKDQCQIDEFDKSLYVPIVG